MTDDSRKVGLRSTVDPTGAKQGINEIKQELGTLPAAAAKAAQGAGAGLDKLGKDAETAARRSEGASRSLVSQIQRQDAALASGGKNTAAYFEAIGKQRGIDPQVLAPYLAQLKATEAAQSAAGKSLDGVGMSAKATAAALRQVPAQFTDIVTSLASGQQPLTVLLQQGGQLKDTFGGVGEATKALGGYIVGLINPVNLTVAAVGALAVATYKAAAEQQGLQRQAILTGDAVGYTAAQLTTARDAIARLSGSSRSRVAEVLGEIATSAGIGADNLEQFAAAALKLERAGGGAAEKTADAFKSLARDPLTASLKLNESFGYLTRSTYEQIKALQDQGRSTDAARIAQEAYLRAIDDQIPKLVRNLGTLDRVLLNVKDAAGKVFDAMGKIGQDPSLEDRIQAIQKGMAANQRWLDAGLFSGTMAQNNTALREQLDLLEKQKRAEEDKAKAAASGEAKKAALVRWDALTVQYLTDEQQLEQAIAKARNDGLAAGVNQIEVERQIGLMRERADPRLYMDRIATAENAREEEIKRGLIEINGLRQRGALNEYEVIDKTYQLQSRQLASQRTSLQEQLGYAAKRADSDKEVSQIQAKLAANTQAQATLAVQYQNDIANATNARKVAAEQANEAERELNRSATDAMAAANAKTLALYTAGLDNNIRALGEESGLLKLQASLLGASQSTRSRAIEYYRIELDLKKRILEIDQLDADGGDAVREELRAKARAEAAQRRMVADQRATLSQWQENVDSINSSLTDALLRGFESGKGFAKNLRDTVVNMFKTMVLRPIIQAIVQPIAGGLGTLITGTGGGLGGLGNLGGLGSLVSNAGSFFGSDWLKALGGKLGGGAAASAGASAATGAAGSAGSAASGLAAFGPWGALIAAGMGLSGNAFDKGFNQNNLPWTKTWLMTGGLAPPSLKFDTNLLEKIGVSSKLANIITGASLWSSVFGRADPQVQESGITGSIGGGNVSGQNYADWKAKGGWFRSDKYGTNYSAIDAEIDAVLDKSAKGVLTQTQDWAKALGLPAEILASITTSFKTKLTGNAEEDQKAVEALMQQYQVTLTGQFSAALTPFQQAGEKLTDTLQRLAGLQSFSDTINGLGGIFSKVATSSVAAKEGLLAMVGGADQFIQLATGFVTNYYNRDEIAGGKAANIQDSLKGLGLSMDFGATDAKAQFRALVEATDISTEAGQKRLATLLGLQGDFSDVAAYLSETGKSLSEVAGQAPEYSVLAPMLASGTTQTVKATNEVRDAIEALHETIKAAGAGGGGTVKNAAWTEVGLASS